MVVNSLDPDGTKLAEALKESKVIDSVYGDSEYNTYKKMGLLDDFWGGKAFDLIVGARVLGIGSGYETNSTGGNWDTPITRQDAAMMVYQGLKALKGNDLYVTMGVAENRNGGKKLIGDWDELTDTDVPDGHPQSVSGCAHPDDILSLYEAGILQGDSESKFYPNKYLTREDSAIIIDKAVNPEKRAKVTIPEADKEIDKTEGVENTTLKQTDPTRRGAIDGDTFIKADGTSIKVVRDEKSGVIGANQPVALDMGRELVRTSNEGKRIEHKIANYGEVKLSDGSLSVNLGYISNDKISADENTYSGKGDYYYNPKTGEGHSSTDWSKIAESLKPTGEGKPGDIKKVGLGDWCTYKYYDGVGWNCETVTGSDLTEAFTVDK